MTDTRNQREALGTRDRQLLRGLAGRVAEAAADPVMGRRRAHWTRHNSLRDRYPIIWLSPEGGWRELLPDDALACEAKRARRIEHALRRQVYCYEHFCDDNVIEPHWIVPKVVHSTGWGLQERWRWSDDPTGARAFDPVIHRPDDLRKLRRPQVRYDEAESLRRLEEAEQLFGDLLTVRLRGVACVSFHLMMQYTALRGLEQVMIDMIENPGMLHEAMEWFTEAHEGIVRQWAEQGLLELNNDGTYHASGGNGYTDELPPADFDPGRVRPKDMWASAEAQEMAQVSPAMHEEFVLQYERRLLSPFGLNGYGCCEDLGEKLDDVLRVPNMRRISISPFADVRRCAEKLGDRVIFSWKPHPAMIAGAYNPDRIRRYIRRTLEITRANGCVVEMILKDTHTCDGHPERFDRWCRIAREEVRRAAG